MTTDTPDLHCSFCGKSKDEVTKIIAGPSACICEECVATCNDILSDMQDRQARLHGQPDSHEH